MGKVTQDDLREPVALLHEHAESGDVEVELFRHGAGCLTDADREAGWTETELYAARTNNHAELVEALRDLETAEYEYRKLHDLHGDGDLRTGRAWDWMRRKGDAARKALSLYGGEAP